MNKNDDIYFLKLAIELAKENVKNGGGPFGAVIVKDGQIIAKGTNRVTSHNDPTAHAEIVAIRQACEKLNDFQLTDCIIYSSCEPCPMCLGAIYWARPKKLVFAADKFDAANAGFDDSMIYDEIQLPYSDRHLETINLRIDESLQPFELWMSENNKITY
ncbi:MAG: Guanine deaminase [Bacteroidetes bacterium ADurb.Bin035]|jgi:guanine deaminase|nr:MAG: Guanine deaminase [Bacteroidetes bacterium ADurb.Bin035]HNQ20485.1 nucleoside deaminase [Bacteroidales bacterium]HNW20339.1 nucleoside deaminase [Bacteroidales bacterium]HPM40657.1 nucleoside deaminase [Bacteroidales bacterium]